MIAVLCVLVSALFAYLRVDGFRSEAFQAFAHFWVAAMFVSGFKNVWPELKDWWRVEMRPQPLRPFQVARFPTWTWYQVGLGIALTVVEVVVAFGGS